MKKLLVLISAAALAAGVHAAQVTVQAATSLSHALREIAPLFEAAHPGTRLAINAGASGALLQQIARGAPADVFASADQETMDQAQALKLLSETPAGRRRDVVSNTLVLVVPASRSVLPASLADLATAAFARIAVAHPASAPAGRHAKAALERARLWAAVEPKVIGVHNVRQALDYVARDEVDAGFVYATDVQLVPDKVRVGFTVALPQPIRSPVAALAAAPNAAGAERFVQFLLTPAAQAVFTRHGFGRP